MVEYKIQTLLRAEIFVAKNIGTFEQRQTLIDELYEVRELYPDPMNNSNPGCWRKANPCRDINWIMEDHLLPLINKAVTFYQNEDDYFGSRIQKDNINVEYWANINEPHSRNAIHDHKVAHFSACYYLQATDTGNINFVNPANMLAECNTGSPFVRDFRFKPRDGDLYLWPSWVPHEVETNFSQKDRVNLAFDFKVVD